MAVLTQTEFATKYEQLFADNEFRNITEETFRTLKDDIRDSFVNLKSLTVKQVRGAVYPVPYTDNLGLIPADYRILGMEAVARNGTDAATGGAGVVQPPITYQLIRDSAGDVDALVDEQPDTTVTVRARWVRTSGTADEQLDSFPPFEQEDRTPSYQLGDRFSVVLDGGIRRLGYVKKAQGYYAATPTGEDDENYSFYAPLTSGGGVMSDADVKAAYERNADTNAYTDSEQAKLSGMATGATANATDAQLRARSSHTGTQAISTVTGLQTALDGKAPVETYDTLLYAASLNLDFASSKSTLLVSATGNLSISATTNRAQGRTRRLEITNATGAAITLAWPGWTTFGLVPTTLAQNKVLLVTLECLAASQATEAGVRAGFTTSN